LKTKGFFGFHDALKNHEKFSMVAWGGIKPPTQGFSIRTQRLQYNYTEWQNETLEQSEQHLNRIIQLCR
jgi:hypothetical protein